MSAATKKADISFRYRDQRPYGYLHTSNYVTRRMEHTPLAIPYVITLAGEADVHVTSLTKFGERLTRSTPVASELLCEIPKPT